MSSSKEFLSTTSNTGKDTVSKNHPFPLAVPEAQISMQLGRLLEKKKKKGYEFPFDPVFLSF